MTVLHHAPDAICLGSQAWRPVCGCGWRGKELCRKRQPALAMAERHAEMKGCGKTRFHSKAAADDAVIKAKIARGLKGNERRREQRAYLCPDCPGKVWHLTSRGAA